MYNAYIPTLFQIYQAQSTYQISAKIQQAQYELNEYRRCRDAWQTDRRNQALDICRGIADISIGLALKPYPMASAVYDGAGALTTANPIMFAYKMFSFIDSIGRIA